MKILSIGNFTTGWDGSICDEEHIASALERMGHEVYRMQRENVGLDTPGDIDFALIAQWDGYPKDLIRYLKEHCRKIVYWAFDHQPHDYEWHNRLVNNADLYLSKRLADAKFPNWRWLSQDFAPNFLEPHYDGKDKDIDVLFTGTYIPWARDRIETLKAVDEKFDLHVYSVTPEEWRKEGLKNVHNAVVDHGLPELIGRAKINLSVDWIIEAGYWSDRNAQIMACGGFVLFRYVPLSEAVFRDNIAYFYDIEDCLKKIEEYLDNDFEREYMATSGRAYAQGYLMVDNRVRDLLTIVESIL